MASIFKITAGAAVVATALYAAAGYLAVPTLVKSTLADTLGKQLGRSVTVTNVAFNPWTWEFTLEGSRLQARTTTLRFSRSTAST